VTVRQPQLPVVEPQVDTVPSRLFLTHFGFFEIFMRTRLHALSFSFFFFFSFLSSHHLMFIVVIFDFFNRFYPVKPAENLLSAFQQLDIASEYVNY
jgi:hypothetical protein